MAHGTLLPTSHDCCIPALTPSVPPSHPSISSVSIRGVSCAHCSIFMHRCSFTFFDAWESALVDRLGMSFWVEIWISVSFIHMGWNAVWGIRGIPCHGKSTASKPWPYTLYFSYGGTVSYLFTSPSQPYMQLGICINVSLYFPRHSEFTPTLQNVLCEGSWKNDIPFPVNLPRSNGASSAALRDILVNICSQYASNFIVPTQLLGMWALWRCRLDRYTTWMLHSCPKASDTW